MKKVLLLFWARFRHNSGLKLISLLFAVLMWNYAVGEMNPPRTMTISGIPISLSAPGALSERGLTLVAGELPSVQASFKVPVRSYRYVSQNDVRAVVDVEDIDQEGTYKLRVRIVSLNAAIDLTDVRIVPAEIEITVDKMQHRELPVRAQLNGSLPHGYWMGQSTLVPSMITVTGAGADVSRLAYAQVQLEVSQLRNVYEGALDIVLYDKNGDALPVDGMTLSSHSSVLRLPVYPVKAGVEVFAQIQGSVKPGYRIDEVVVEPADAAIAGLFEMIEEIDLIRTLPIDVEGLDMDKEFAVKLDIPEQTYLVGSDQVKVTVKVKEIEQTRIFRDLQVDLPAGARLVQGQQINVEVTGPASLVAALRQSDIQLSADVSAIAAGATGQAALSAEILAQSAEQLTVSVLPERVQVTVR